MIFAHRWLLLRLMLLLLLLLFAERAIARNKPRKHCSATSIGHTCSSFPFPLFLLHLSSSLLTPSSNCFPSACAISSQCCRTGSSGTLISTRMPIATPDKPSSTPPSPRCSSVSVMVPKTQQSLTLGEPTGNWHCQLLRSVGKLCEQSKGEREGKG